MTKCLAMHMKTCAVLVFKTPEVLHSTPIRDRISAAPPRCCLDTRPAKEECVSGEQQGGDAETLSRTGADHGN